MQAPAHVAINTAAPRCPRPAAGAGGCPSPSHCLLAALVAHLAARTVQRMASRKRDGVGEGGRGGGWDGGA